MVVFGKDDGKATKLEAEAEVTGQYLVGAEKERERMEGLLDKRRRLLGRTQGTGREGSVEVELLRN